MSEARFESESDFVANYLLPELKTARDLLETQELGKSHVSLHVNVPVDGFADLTVERAGRRILVIEAKFKKKAGKIERDIEPRDPEVIRQAVGYAGMGGFPFYATCNARRMVLFQHRPDKAPFESEIYSLEYAKSPEWAQVILKTVLGVIPARLRALDDSLVQTLHEAFSDLFPEFLVSLRNRFREKPFMTRYVEWLDSQGIRFSDDSNRLIAEQATYLQLNKLLFYQVLREIYPTKLHLLRIKEDQDVQTALEALFEEVKRIDYEPVYQSDILTEIPFTSNCNGRIRTLIDTLNDFDFSRMESDFLGRVYEKLIPGLERKRLGQFYTPPSIVDLIVQLTVDNPKSRILDPGCGSGSFLVKTYHQLRELNHIPRGIGGGLDEHFHQQLLNSIFGIDINQFPAHLSVINLVIQSPKTKVQKVGVAVKDFFDIRPGEATLSGFQGITTKGERTLVQFPSQVDAIVSNPPYIEQELLGKSEKKKLKNLIESEYKNKVFIGTPSKKGQKGILLDRMSDIYVYFFIHGIKFLRDSGRLGFISSNKWLEVDYGLSFQEFLLEFTKILFVIELDQAVFPDADVNTAITILQKEPNESRRRANRVKFVRVKKKLDLHLLLRSLRDVEENFEDETIRFTIQSQSSLIPGKWSLFLRGPLVLQRLIQHSKIRPLNSFAEVFRGPTTGYDEFFELSQEKAKERKIEAKYLVPIISSPRKIRELVAEESSDHGFLFASDEPRTSMKGTNALRYIEHGEKQTVEPRKGAERESRPITQVATVKNRRFWYNVPVPQIAPILVVKMMDKHLRAIFNKARFHASNLFYYVTPKDESDSLPLLAYLNSSFAALMAELYGRSYGGGVLELAAYELKQLPAVDPKLLGKSERKRLALSFENLARALSSRIKAEDVYGKGQSKLTNIEPRPKERLQQTIDDEAQAQKGLDEAIYDVLGLTKPERKQLEDALRELRELRRLRTKT